MSSSSTIAVNVRNTWKTDAPDVEVELWNGHPDSSGSELLSSTVADTVHAHGKTAVELSASGLDGNVELFVRLDPDDVLPERSETNNLASREFLAFPYESSFPTRTEIGSIRPIVIADVRAGGAKEFLITGSGAGPSVHLQCFSTEDTIPLWSFAEAAPATYSNPVVGHVYKTARKYIALQFGSPLKVRLFNGETGAVVKTRLSNDLRPFLLETDVVSWTMSDFGADDEAMELVALVDRESSGADTLLVRVFAPNGPILSSATVDEGFSISLQPATMAVADLDRNGSKDIVVSMGYATTGDELKVFSFSSGNLSPLWSGNVSDGNDLDVPTLVLFDRDEDGEVEVLCNGHYSTVGSFLRLYLSDGTIPPAWANDLLVTDTHSFSAGDIDDDGFAEIVVADHERLRVVSPMTRDVLDSKTMRGDPVSPPYLVDLDADGKLDVVILYEQRDANYYFYPQPYLVHLYVLDENLDHIEPVRTFRTPDPSTCAPAIDDIDHDGKYEMVYASTDDYLHVFELGAAAGESAWQQRFANELLSGANEQPIIGTYSNPVSLYQRSRMLGEVVLDSIAAPSLYVGHGTDVRVDTSSVGYQLRAYGSVRMKGSANAPVRFFTQPSAGLQATWDGIYIDSGVTTSGDPDTLSRVTISDASVGVNAKSPLFAKWTTISNASIAGIASNDWLKLRSCTIADGAGVGLLVGGGASSVAVSNCLVDGWGSFGIDQTPAGTLAVDSTVVRNSSTGIRARAATSTVSNSTIEDCSSNGAIFNDGSFSASGTMFQGNGTGLRIQNDSGPLTNGSVLNCTVRNGTDGIWIGDIGDTTIAVDGCTIVNHSASGIYVDSDGGASITDNSVDSCDTWGVYLAAARETLIDDTTIRECDTGISAHGGITVVSNSAVEDCSTYGAVFRDGTVRIAETSFSGNDTGLHLATDTSAGIAATIRYSTFSQNVDGIRIDDGGDSTVVIDTCLVDHNTTNGIYVEGSGDVRITRSSIAYSVNGVHSYASGPAIRSRSRVQYNTNGIKCDVNSYAAVESCTVNNNTYGVTVVDGSPALGQQSGGTSAGFNNFKPNTTYHVRNFTTSTVVAQQNYWPQKATSPIICTPKPTMFYGPVDTSYYLCDPPLLSSPAPFSYSGDDEARRLPVSFGLGQNYPNPFNPTTTVTYDVPSRSDVRIAVYDVAGRLVAVLVDDARVPGSYSVQWKGTDRRGQPVASGIYFVQMRAGTFVGTKKVLLLK